MNKTLVIITGGTIEALYSPEQGTPYYVPVPKTVEESAIPEALAALGLAEQCELWPLSMVDSKDVDRAVLDTVLARIAAEGYARAVLVQGTDAMPQNGRYLQSALLQQGMTATKIILTGAMKPLRDAAGNWHPREAVDGWRNLEMAFADATNPALPAGVYIEMGEGPWNPKRVEKRVKISAAEAGGVALVTQSGFVLLADDV